MVNLRSWTVYFYVWERMGQNAHHGRFAHAERRFAPWCEAKRPLVSFCIFAFREQK